MPISMWIHEPYINIIPTSTMHGFVFSRSIIVLESFCLGEYITEHVFQNVLRNSGAMQIDFEKGGKWCQ